jgi:hypothetical protein
MNAILNRAYFLLKNPLNIHERIHENDSFNFQSVGTMYLCEDEISEANIRFSLYSAHKNISTGYFSVAGAFMPLHAYVLSIQP